MTDLHDAIMHIDNKMIEVASRFGYILNRLADMEERINRLERLIGGEKRNE